MSSKDKYKQRTLVCITDCMMTFPCNLCVCVCVCVCVCSVLCCGGGDGGDFALFVVILWDFLRLVPVSYTHLRAHETA